MLSFFVFIFFLSIVLYGVIQKKWMAGIYIVIIYALSSFCSIIIESSFPEPKMLPTILYCSLLFITLKPFIRNKPKIEGFSSVLERKRFLSIGYIFSIAVIIGMILILPRITAAINYGLVDVRTAMYHGEQVYTEDKSVFMTFGSLLVGYFGGIWYLYIIMFFYALVFIRGKNLLKVLLVIASLSQVEVGLTVGGRTNAIYWLMSFLFTLVVFYPYLNHRIRNITILTSVAFMSIVFMYVASITIQRSLYREGGTQAFLIGYMGESYLYFCEFFDKIDWHPYTLERVFPFSSYLLKTGFNLTDYRDLIVSHTGMDIGIFYTFMGDIFVDLGLVGLLLFVLIYFKVSSSVLTPNVFHLKDLCYLSLIYVIPLHGLFYYSFWKSGDFQILFIVLIVKYLTMGDKGNKVTSTLKIINNEEV